MVKGKRARKSSFLEKEISFDDIATLIKGVDFIDIAAAMICAFAGYQAGAAFGADAKTRLGMAGSGILAYKLALSDNLIAGASGTGLLAAYGVLDLWNPLRELASQLLPFEIEPTIQEELKKNAVRRAAGWMSALKSLPVGMPF